MHPTVHMLIHNKHAIIQDDSSPTDSVRSVQSRFEGHEDALEHLPWPA